MRAQEAFALMMREQVAPGLRALGFKGSGQSYSLPSDRYHALVGFQKSTSSSSEVVKFTVNLTVVSRAAWADAYASRPWIGVRPRPNVQAGIGAGEWHARIGQLLPAAGDRWWQVEPDRPTEPVAEEVLDCIRDYALPAIRARLDP